jgi:hypothetical protein
VSSQTTIHSQMKDNSKGTKEKTSQHRRNSNQRPPHHRGKSEDYVYGKVHYRVKPAK